MGTDNLTALPTIRPRCRAQPAIVFQAFLVFLVTTFATLRSAEAQAPHRPNTREGLWFGGGLGLGSSGAHCSQCASTRHTGLSWYLRAGGTVSTHLLAGAE